MVCVYYKIAFGQGVYKCSVGEHAWREDHGRGRRARRVVERQVDLVRVRVRVR